METELNNMSVGCDPQVFYEQIRPWFRGIDVNNLKEGERRWIFEGIEMDEGLEEPTELSGPSAGQSSIIHALDVFLGVEQFSHARTLTGRSSETAAGASENVLPDDASSQPSSFLSRMQLYMPRHHRNFLTHLQNQNTKCSLRALVFDALASAGLSSNGIPCSSTHSIIPSIPSHSSSSLSSLSPSSAIATDDALALISSYNAAILALKKFRDAHIVIEDHEFRMAAGTTSEVKPRETEPDAPLKGSGGTELAPFLKAVRDGTKDAVVGSSL
ncbi:Indoleamine 2,3-dioxygenase [Rhodocollybia butyracea]|uniref:Indoleamine 2,3-dioxygenase n=1 Tax=Rhodocollybia butyracea TaxID=206335 RepID=A0A9P5PMS2_9AGAR|nr:Indoleamine 2,3-dioxygenase [Rhodocollybia butyracea]